MSKFKRLLPTILMIIFELAIGVMLLIDGEKFTQTIFIVFGVFMLICGIITLIFSLTSGKVDGRISVGNLVVAVMLIAIGGFFTAASGSVMGVMSTMMLVYGIIMVINGILKLFDFLSHRRQSPVAGFAIFGAIISIVLGIVIAFNPFGATEVVWTILGIILIASAVVDMISLILYKSALNDGGNN